MTNIIKEKVNVKCEKCGNIEAKLIQLEEYRDIHSTIKLIETIFKNKIIGYEVARNTGYYVEDHKKMIQGTWCDRKAGKMDTLLPNKQKAASPS